MTSVNCSIEFDIVKKKTSESKTVELLVGPWQLVIFGKDKGYSFDKKPLVRTEIDVSFNCKIRAGSRAWHICRSSIYSNPNGSVFLPISIKIIMRLFIMEMYSMRRVGSNDSSRWRWWKLSIISSKTVKLRKKTPKFICVITLTAELRWITIRGIRYNMRKSDSTTWQFPHFQMTFQFQDKPKHIDDTSHFTWRKWICRRLHFCRRELRSLLVWLQQKNKVLCFVCFENIWNIQMIDATK